MGNQFNALQKSVFKAKRGAYSVITSKDEAKKRQITLTGKETKLVEDYFGKEQIHKGPVKSNLAKSTKTFFIYNKNSEGHLKLNYPKPAKPELRLYMNAGEGFQPEAGEIWFVFQPEDQQKPLVVGSMKPDQWESIGSKDEGDEEYQELFSDTVPVVAGAQKTKTTTGYERKKDVALSKMKQASYRCEADGTHMTFISPVTGNNFVEPHHLIPMKAQADFKHSLDVKENIVVLCPNCHRKIHYGGYVEKEVMLKQFHEDLADGLGKRGLEISLETLKTYYNMVNI